MNPVSGHSVGVCPRALAIHPSLEPSHPQVLPLPSGVLIQSRRVFTLNTTVVLRSAGFVNAVGQ